MTRHTTVSLLLAMLLLGGVAAQDDPLPPGTAGGGEGGETMTAPDTASQASSSSEPWWRQQKIRYFWGHWVRYPQESMREVIHNCARVGATVFVTNWARGGEEEVSGFNLEEARAARDYGVRYFCHINAAGLHERGERMGAPHALAATGEPYRGYGTYAEAAMPCPLYGPLLEEHMLGGLLPAAASGLVDGVNLDWEPYGRPYVSDTCYCEHCLTEFLAEQGLEADPEAMKPASRHPWLVERDLLETYEQSQQQRRLALWEGIRDRVHEVKADFIFAGYHVFDWTLRAGLHSPQTPFVVVDPRHYYEDQTRAWWQSYHAREHALGYLVIAHTYDITFFGYQPEAQASAAQWMYDAAINTDGFSLWFEERWSPEMWRSHWIADRRLRATESRVGEYLLRGRQDRNFVIPIAWSGDPSLQEKILHRTYHLGDEPLVHLHNVDTDRPAQVRLRFPRLPAASRWVVQDPIGGLLYTNQRDEAVWSAEDLDEGLLVAMENRSELFLKISPPRPGDPPARTATVSGRMAPPLAGDWALVHPSWWTDNDDLDPGSRHPWWEELDLTHDPADGPAALVYTRAEDMGYLRPYISDTGWSLGNAIWAIGEEGAGNRRLGPPKDDTVPYAATGYVWDPVWSPDGTRVAFSHYADGRGQIWVMSADGTEVVNVSDNPHCDRSPVWSPDSGRLAFVSDRGGNWDLCVMNADGSDQRPLTSDAGCNHAPTWSPDGTHLAFTSNREGDFNVWITDLDGGSQRVLLDLPGDQREPAWSPDGNRIAFVDLTWSFPQVAVVDVDTGAYTRTLYRPTHVSSLRWSPDGTRIAGVYRRLTWGDGAQSTRIAGIFVIPVGFADVYVDPDEHTVVWGEANTPYAGGRRDPTYLPTWYSHGSASPRWVADTFSGLCWSPDGEHLAFSANLADDGHFHVYTVPAEGGEVQQLLGTASAWPQAVDWARR